MAPAKKSVEKGAPQRSIQAFFSKKPAKSPIRSTPGKRKVPLVIGDVDALKQETERVLPVIGHVEVKTPETKQTLGNKKKASLVVGHVQAPAPEVKSSPGRKKTRDFGSTDTGNVKAKSDDIILEDVSTPPKRRRLRKSNNDSSDTSSFAASPECTIGGKRLQPISTPSPIDTAASAKMHRGSMLFYQSPECRVRDSPELVIGKKLRVYWPLDKAWYAGQVKAFNAKLGKHVVVYDDGEEEDVDLEKEKVEWIEGVEDGKEIVWSTRKRSQPQNLTSGSKRLKSDAKDVSAGKESLSQEENGERQTRGRARRQVIYEEESEASDAVDDDDDEDDADFQVASEKSEGEASDPADDGDELSDLEDEDNIDDDQISSRDKRRKSQPSGKASGKKVTGQSTAGKTLSLALNVKGSASKKDSSSGRTSIFGGLESVRNSAKDPASNTQLNLGNESSLVGEAVDRFGGRDAQKFKFLGKDRKDAAGKKPSDLAYDPRTLHLPADFLKSLSGGQRQWWMFKAKHMDKVLFFKMGKFYEMFEMDAHIGAKELDLQYMKGEQPHCGFPEKNFSDNAEKLARKGYRVLVVEQTETPDQLERRRKETGSKDKVVMREVCAVITRGTMIDGDMVTSSSEASIILSVTERPLDSDSSMIGLCVVDASTSCFQLGQFEDDAARTHLCSVLTELRPVELIVPRGTLSAATSRALRDCTRQPLLNELNCGEFWDAVQTVKEVTKVYSHLKCPTGKVTANEEDLPEVLRHVKGLGDEGELALSAFGACVFYLRQALLDQTLLSLGRVELLPGYNRISGDFSSMKVQQSKGGTDAAVHKVEPYMVLDGAALENLEVLENRDGGTHGTLLAKLDHCATPFGRRLLKGWLARPLLLVESIQQRQIAVADLKGVASEAAALFRKELAGVPDMERTLARLHASSEANGRNASKVVMYEDVGKKQVHQFTAALRGCRSMLQAAAAFKSCLPELSSTRLRDLLTTGKGMPDMMSVIEHFETAFDWTEAEKSGRIVPHEGVDDDFDAASGIVIEVEEQLAAYLEKQRKHFGNSSQIVYLTVGKEAYQMEVPDRFLAKVPPEFEVRSSRKGCRRYWSPEIKSLLQELAAGQEQRESALKGILMRLVHKFCEDYSIWLSAVKSIAEVDVLISISAAVYVDGATCTPKFSESGQHVPWFNAKSLRHPTIGGTLAGGNSFVPNDIALGGEKHAPFILLTGPNMGGKSTLLRQVCLAVILAQVGADVPAAELELAPVDQVFVRMGARDHIMAGQSTFLVELQETATMLRSATRNSLVALDELGRGTATSDGQAIAHAVLHRLTQEVGCRGMFSTHYHRLATDHASDPTVALCHMGCKVASTKGGTKGGTEEVTFLYTLSPGACPKSYGVNVARLAGMPESILQRAGARSAELEHLFEDSNDSQNQAVDAPDPSVCKLLKSLGSLLQESGTGSDTLLPLWKEATRIVTVSAC